MKRVLIAGLMFASGLTGASALADTGPWYASPMGQYSLLDDKRAAKDAFGFGIALGKNFMPHLAGECN
jgi:hypothetical protein